MMTPILGALVSAVVALLGFAPLLESLRRWRVAALSALSLWVLTVLVEGLVPDNAWAEQAVLVTGSIAVLVLLTFVVLVVRNPRAMTSERVPGTTTGAVQAVLAILVWGVAATISAVAVVVAEPDRAFHQISTGMTAVAWQSVDTIPVLSVPDTLGWETPVPAAEGYVAWHMLLARAAFVVSVLAVGKAIYEQQFLAREPRRATPSIQGSGTTTTRTPLPSEGAEALLKELQGPTNPAIVEPTARARTTQPKAANRSRGRKPE